MDHCDDQDNTVPAYFADFLDECEILRPSNDSLEDNDDTAMAALETLLASPSFLPESVPLFLYESDDMAGDSSSVVTSDASDGTIGAGSGEMYRGEMVVAEDRTEETKRSQASRRQRKYLRKQKHKQETLKQQEKTLSYKVAKLCRARKKANNKHSRNPQLLIWCAEVLKQKKTREEAEEERENLKDAVATQGDLMAEVEESLQKQSDSLQASCVPPLNECGLESDADDSVLFEEFLQDMDLLYAKTSDVFRVCEEAAPVPANYKLQPQWKQNGELEFVENRDVVQIPFGFEQTCNAIWASMQHRWQSGRAQYKNITDPENTVAVKFLISNAGQDIKIPDMLVHFVTRRYKKEGRMVIVWRALLGGEGKFANMHSDETGWCIMYPVNDNKEEGATIPTEARSFVRLAPMNVGENIGSIDVDQASKMAQVSEKEGIQMLAHMMESLVLNKT